MTAFIASRIMEEADKRWKDNVDTILKTDGYDEVIVEN